MLKKIEMFTDGSCLYNPGPGGLCTIIRYKKYRKIIKFGFYYTTNNRMELMAAIVGLEFLLKPCIINLTTDSQYLRLGIILWIYNWKKNNWLKKNKKPVRNKDLWLRLDQALKKHIVTWVWTKSHNNHQENEICDKIAKKEAKNPKNNDLLI
ncbi:ribonuclease H [Buchnera aphidicola (Cinara tujafilina)]|uniref:Ribonuclease H n=1 Tax=Buchnera aphidicola (Cinara tujafilina) TaxID=261317 RepID=F7WZ92_9GAMM|nr:ribonuclease HI [Buchnera aphidicola]AEH39746.1 ribonuclease H [Buchnera aphidicola (Cinara tujafilina)]